MTVIYGNFNGLALVDASTTALGASGTYNTPSPFTTAGSAKVVGTVFTDQAGTVYVDQSSDGTNWDATSSVSVTANTPTSFSVEVVAPYGRLRYVNGATAQTKLRLYGFTRSI